MYAPSDTKRIHHELHTAPVALGELASLDTSRNVHELGMSNPIAAQQDRQKTLTSDGFNFRPYRPAYGSNVPSSISNGPVQMVSNMYPHSKS